MTPIADMIEKMSADGVPMASILLAVRTAEQVAARGNSTGIPVDAAAEKRRAWDRERKAKKPKSTGVSTGIPPEQKTPSLSEKNEAQGLKEAKREKRGARIPPDWQPSERDVAYAISKGIQRERIPTIAEKFKNNFLAKTGPKAISTDWHLNWCNWIINEIEWNGAKNGHQPSPNGTSQASRSGATGQDAILAGMGRLADRVRARGDAERREREASDDGGVAAGNAARLL